MTLAQRNAEALERTCCQVFDGINGARETFEAFADTLRQNPALYTDVVEHLENMISGCITDHEAQTWSTVYDLLEEHATWDDLL